MNTMTKNFTAIASFALLALAVDVPAKS